MSVNADFVAFFNGPFQRQLEEARVPGVENASWDRRAAWLLWQARGGEAPPEPAAAPSASKLRSNLRNALRTAQSRVERAEEEAYERAVEEHE